MDSFEGRKDFIVDVFKIMRWMINLRTSEDNLHLLPGVRK